MAVVAPAFRQLGGTMAAAVGKRRRLSVMIKEDDDFLAQQGERLWPIRKPVGRHGRIPEAAEDLLFGAEHGCFLPWADDARRVTTRAASWRSCARSIPGIVPALTTMRP